MCDNVTPTDDLSKAIRNMATSIHEAMDMAIKAADEGDLIMVCNVLDEVAKTSYHQADTIRRVTSKP